VKVVVTAAALAPPGTNGPCGRLAVAVRKSKGKVRRMIAPMKGGTWGVRRPDGRTFCGDNCHHRVSAACNRGRRGRTGHGDSHSIFLLGKFPKSCRDRSFDRLLPQGPKKSISADPARHVPNMGFRDRMTPPSLPVEAIPGGDFVPVSFRPPSRPEPSARPRPFLMGRRKLMPDRPLRSGRRRVPRTAACGPDRAPRRHARRSRSGRGCRAARCRDARRYPSGTPSGSGCG
jgi:hypothetical protein